MRRAIIVTILQSISLFSISQTLKKYSGEFPNEYGTKGTATYTYYEDPKTAEYVKHGLFKYTMKEGNNYNAIFSGNFKNGKRDGIWTFSITRLDDPGDNVYYTGTIQMTANYINGLPNGMWTYNKTMKYRGKVFSFGSYKWTNYEIQPTVSVTANFKNGITVGAIKINNDIGKFSTITGEFNPNGFLDKTWTLRSNRQEIKMTFNNGIQTSFVDRDFPQGKVYENITDDEETSKLKNDFLTHRITTTDLLKKRISIDTISAVKNDLYSFVFTFYSDFFNYKNIEGDDTYEEGKNIRDDGYYFLFKKAELKSITEIVEFNDLENRTLYNQSDYSDAISRYEYLISFYKLNLSDEDILKVQNKIEQLKKGKVSAGKKKDLESADYWFTKSYFDKAIEEYESYLENWKTNLSQEEVGIINTKIQQSKEGIAKQKIEAEKLEVQKKENQLKRQKEQEEQSDRTQISKLKDIIFGKWYTIDNSYGTNTSSGGRSYAKYSIYDVFKTTYDEYQKTIQLSYPTETLKQTIEYYNKVVQIADKVIALASIADTKELEKEIRKAKTLDEKQSILLSFSLNN